MKLFPLTIAGLGSKYRLLVGAFDKVAEPSRLVKRAVAPAGVLVFVGSAVPSG